MMHGFYSSQPPSFAWFIKALVYDPRAPPDLCLSASNVLVLVKGWSCVGQTIIFLIFFFESPFWAGNSAPPVLQPHPALTVKDVSSGPGICLFFAAPGFPAPGLATWMFFFSLHLKSFPQQPRQDPRSWDAPFRPFFKIASVTVQKGRWSVSFIFPFFGSILGLDLPFPFFLNGRHAKLESFLCFYPSESKNRRLLQASLFFPVIPFPK